MTGREGTGTGEGDAPDAAIEALWKRVSEAWDDERTHAALLDCALRAEALPEIARRYRSLLDDPAKAPIAKARLDAIVVAATNLLASNKTRKPERVPLGITLSAASVCAVLLLWLAWAIFGKH
jgi:hypothetical protein